MKFNLAKQISLYIGVLVLVVCLGMGLTAYKLSSDALINEADDALMLLAEEGVNNIEAVIQGNFNTLETIANRNSVRSMDWEEQLEPLQNEFRRLENRGYLGVGVVFPDGNTRYVDGSEANLGDRDYVQRAFAGETNVSDVINSRVTNEAVLMYATPIYDLNGEVGGVLIARRPGDALNDLTDQMGYGEEGYANIIGSEGTLFSHPTREYVMDQRNAITEVENDGELKNWGMAIQELGLGNSGVITYELQGSEIHMGLATFSSTDWTLGVVATEAELLEGLNELRTYIIIGSIVFLILGIGFALFVGRLIATPMTEAANFATTMASGDLTQNVSEKYLARNDEIGELSKAFKILNQSFQQTIGEIQSTAQELAASSQQMSSVSESSSANMEEVSASTEEISASLEEVSASSEQVSASSEEMNTSTTELVTNMKKGNQTAREIEEKAVKIQGEVVDSQEKATRIYKELDSRLKEGIEKAKIVNEISYMADQIAGIAEQTNLLALNAAIEAARAGEQGKGFAVVAEEVRKLATDSTETVTNIQGLTEKVQDNIKSLIEDTNELLKYMNTDVDGDYKKFLETAEEYKKDANTFYSLTDNASQMGEKVLNSVSEVSKSIDEVTQTISQSAEGANQIAQGTDETSKSMVEINKASNRLANMSEELTNLISKFKV
ncbi:methyl-accepting chemotaxis protein [Desulfitispora alkaliphila]|uniref:methyl-accepting chemotaxis protein n=1 Tax=Desulfitispora alkaliphila TaxID=622674 RepID=UPI003D223077